MNSYDIAVLDIHALALALGTTPAGIRVRRCRGADLPAPYSRRPLLWRRSTVEAWMASRETQLARQSIERE